MLCFVFAALVVALDQFFKHWIVLTLDIHDQMDLIPGVIGLTHIQNKGAAFSILQDQRWLLAGISFVAAIVIIFILLRYTEGFWGTLGLAAVLGGTVGNLIDRVFQGYVVDMFRPLFIDFAIFNIADIFLTLGFATFCIHFIVSTIKSPKPRLAEAESAETVNVEEEAPDDIFDITEGYDIPDYDDLSDTKDIPTLSGLTDQDSRREQYGEAWDYNDYHENGLEQQVMGEPVTGQEGFLQPDPAAAAQQEDAFSALGALRALGALESELSSVEDLDVDELLREYGFEDNADDLV